MSRFGDDGIQKCGEQGELPFDGHDKPVAIKIRRGIGLVEVADGNRTHWLLPRERLLCSRESRNLVSCASVSSRDS